MPNALTIRVIDPRDRTCEYTKPGYEGYGRFVADELKREVDASLRTIPFQFFFGKTPGL